MFRGRRSTICFAVPLVALVALPLSAGVVFEVETTYHLGSERGGPVASEMSVESPNMKMEILPGESQRGEGEVKDEVIWRGDRREMVVVDHREKSYMVFDAEAMKSLGGQVQQAMTEVEKMLEGLDPQQREMVEKAMKERNPAAGPKRTSSEFRRTGETGTRAGYPCVKYDVLRGGEKIRELWITDWSRIEGGGELRHVFEGMAAFFEEMMDSLGELGGNGFMEGNSVFEGLDQVGGFPVVTRDFEGGELESETTLRSARRRTLDPDAFEPPSGYKRRTMF